ncbi:MAG: hypothetical protein ACTSRJ_07210 [Candidatus Hodarchaeales archaeon]
MDKNQLDVFRIHEAFSPAKEIRDPSRFVGRKNEINTGITSLMNRGGFLAIYGLRGVGKSSIAYQLKAIAEGNKILTDYLELKRFLPLKGFNYLVHYYRCDHFINDIGSLIKRILFGDEDNPSLFSLTKTGDRRLTEFKTIFEGETGVDFGLKLSSKGSSEKTYSQYISDDVIQQFRSLLGIIRKDNQNNTGLLILIDEFDTIKNKSGFSSLVKTCSSDFVKFGIVGIASSLTELIKDHGSISRQIDVVSVPRMPIEDLTHILRRAEYTVHKEIIFDENASSTIASLAEGFPYFVHLLGKEAMLIAFERNSKQVTGNDIEYLSKIITEGRLNTIYDDVYHNAVKTSPQREILLKIFSEDDKDEIHTVPVYSLAKDLGVSNPSQLMKELTTTEWGSPVLTKIRDRYYRFTDPVFKVYSRIRNWKY